MAYQSNVNTPRDEGRINLTLLNIGLYNEIFSVNKNSNL